MAAIEVIYEEIMDYLVKTGFGGYVEIIDHDYKNACSIRQHQPPYETTYTDPKTKNARSRAGSFLLTGAASLPNYDEEIIFILNKSPGLTAAQIQKRLKNKNDVKESLRRLKENKIIDYDQYFRFNLVQVVT